MKEFYWTSYSIVLLHKICVDLSSENSKGQVLSVAIFLFLWYCVLLQGGEVIWTKCWKYYMIASTKNFPQRSSKPKSSVVIKNSSKSWKTREKIGATDHWLQRPDCRGSVHWQLHRRFPSGVETEPGTEYVWPRASYFNERLRWVGCFCMSIVPAHCS